MLTKEEKEEGEQKKRLMGLKGAFVAALSRDEQYLVATLTAIDVAYHNYRDSDINQLTLSADYLSQMGITVVGMGRCVKDKVSLIIA